MHLSVDLDTNLCWYLKGASCKPRKVFWGKPYKPYFSKSGELNVLKAVMWATAYDWSNQDTSMKHKACYNRMQEIRCCNKGRENSNNRLAIPEQEHLSALNLPGEVCADLGPCERSKIWARTSGTIGTGWLESWWTGTGLGEPCNKKGLGRYRVVASVFCRTDT